MCRIVGGISNNDIASILGDELKYLEYRSSEMIVFEYYATQVEPMKGIAITPVTINRVTWLNQLMSNNKT
jgi:hypothetical protein